MKIRGQRECLDCGTRWSYYETGRIACPECESLHSVGRGERTEHTAQPVDLDLTNARSIAESEGLQAAITAAAEECRSYTNRTGFIHAGDLQPLSVTYLAANELVYAARETGRLKEVHHGGRPTEVHHGGRSGRLQRLTDEEQLYLLTLLRNADSGSRPPPDAVPESMRSVRALAECDAIAEYRRELREFVADRTAQRALATIRDHVRRVTALDGEISPATTDRLVRATQALSEYVRTSDESSLTRARTLIDEIAFI